MNISDQRKEYARKGLREEEVDTDPIRQFLVWLDDAMKEGLHEPTAMTLATCSTDGWPSARVVLLKHVTEEGFAFFTNYDGRKANDLDSNPRAALAFWWPALERQVRIEGQVERTTAEESDDYFRKRPRGSQLGAWASKQSDVISGREVLEERLALLEQQFDAQEVPRPPFWGGYRVRPIVIEFWQGRPNRLHDRIRYRRVESGGWVVERLSP